MIIKHKNKTYEFSDSIPGLKHLLESLPDVEVLSDSTNDMDVESDDAKDFFHYIREGIKKHDDAKEIRLKKIRKAAIKRAKDVREGRLSEPKSVGFDPKLTAISLKYCQFAKEKAYEDALKFNEKPKDDK